LSPRFCAASERRQRSSGSCQRSEAFQPLGQPAIDEQDHDFSTSTFNEWFGDREYDHGIRFRGELPADFKRRTPEERKATIEAV